MDSPGLHHARSAYAPCFQGSRVRHGHDRKLIGLLSILMMPNAHLSAGGQGRLGLGPYDDRDFRFYRVQRARTVFLPR
jgi:hypothetical protein